MRLPCWRRELIRISVAVSDILTAEILPVLYSFLSRGVVVGVLLFPVLLRFKMNDTIKWQRKPEHFFTRSKVIKIELR